MYALMFEFQHHGEGSDQCKQDLDNGGYLNYGSFHFAPPEVKNKNI